MSTRNATAPLPRYVLRVKAGPSGRPVYAVQWHHERPDGTRMLTSRRLGPAWLDRTPDGEGWTKRRGRPTGEYLDARAAELLIPAAIRRAEAEFAAKASEAARPATFREVAAAFLHHRQYVTGARPSTLADYRSMLAEPGTPHKRGWAKDASGRVRRDRNGQPIRATSPGWIMRAIGDRPAREVTTRDVNRLLGTIAKGGASARTVNKYRALLSSIFGYATHSATFDLPNNPVRDADSRRQPPPRDIEFYGRDEAEHLARTIAEGRHRPETRRRLSKSEAAQRERDNAQDAELVRVAVYSGLRRSELVALRWRDVRFAERQIHVRGTVSAGEEVDAPKSGRRRVVPLTDDAAAALDRLSRREHFTGARDYVFASVSGDRLNPDALGKRIAAGQNAAGLPLLNLHGLRHSFASQAVAHGVGIAEVQAAMGHSDVRTTSRYLHARPAHELADAFTRAQRATSAPATSARTLEGTQR